MRIFATISIEEQESWIECSSVISNRYFNNNEAKTKVEFPFTGTAQMETFSTNLLFNVVTINNHVSVTRIY